MAEQAAIVVTGARLVPSSVVGPPVGDLELRIDRGSITQLGGDPVAAWQIPWTACRDVRVANSRGVVVIALSFGALRYRWELPAAGVPGGPDALVALVRDAAHARPMVRALRGARRRH